MKNLDLNNYGVLEMNAEEMREKNGGWIITAILVVASLSAMAYAIWLKAHPDANK